MKTKLLIIDDEPAVRRILEIPLASDGVETLRSIKSLSPAMPVIMIPDSLDGAGAEDARTMGDDRSLKKTFRKRSAAWRGKQFVPFQRGSSG